MEEYKCQQHEAVQLQEELASAKTRISQLHDQMNKASLDHADQTNSLNEEAAKAIWKRAFNNMVMLLLN